MSGTCVKERPILFSGPMVRGLLDGRKTQTRRIIKPQPYSECGFTMWQHSPHNGCGCVSPPCDCWLERCPYGNPGERLWIKTGYRTRYDEPRNQTYWSIDSCFSTTHGKPLSKSGNEKRDGNHPGMFMPRWLSSDLRLPLIELTDVRVERLQNISDADAFAEGVATERQREGTWYAGKAREMYADLWNSINGPGSWEQNPWVLAITFKRVDEAGQ